MSARQDVERGSGGQTKDTTIGVTRVPTATRTHTISELIDQIETVKDRSRILLEDSHGNMAQISQLHSEGLDLLIEQRAPTYYGRDIVSLLSTLYDLGFSWSDIARMAGVSVPALRKWRRGDSPSPENRQRLAMLVAVCEIVPERSPYVQDVAAWFEMPVSPKAPITGIDLAAAGKLNLVVQHAQGDDPEQILGAFNPDWRDVYQSDIEVFMAEDGHPGLRFRQQDG